MTANINKGENMTRTPSRPTEPGVYWARSRSDFQWHNLIVEVAGEAPWLEILWCFDRGRFSIVEVSSNEILWGPKIEPPGLD